MIVEIFAFFCLAAISFVVGVGAYGAFGGFDNDNWWRMTYEEEMDWLMNEQGLSYEEAKEIAEFPHRVLDK